jgi:hypothetical protein
MLAGKITKNASVDFNSCFGISFYTKIYEMASENYLEINSKIVDNAIK